MVSPANCQIVTGAPWISLHAPRVSAGQRHHHAHILMTCRQLGQDGVSARTHLELSGTERHERGLPLSKDELSWIHETWRVCSISWGAYI